MKNSKNVIDTFARLLEQGLLSSKDIVNELITILKSKRDEIVFKMKLTSKDEFQVLEKRVENLEKNRKIAIEKFKKTKRAKILTDKPPNEVYLILYFLHEI